MRVGRDNAISGHRCWEDKTSILPILPIFPPALSFPEQPAGGADQFFYMLWVFLQISAISDVETQEVFVNTESGTMHVFNTRMGPTTC